MVLFISWIQTSCSSSSSNQQEEEDQENNDSGSNVDTDTDDWSDMESSHNEESNSDSETPHVLLKRKPTHSWNVIKGKSYHNLLPDEGQTSDRKLNTTIH